MGSILRGVILREGGSMKIRMLISSVAVLVVVGLLWGGAPVQADSGPGKIIFEDTKSFASVPFNHDTHKSAGVGCGACHDVLFKKISAHDVRQNLGRPRMFGQIAGRPSMRDHYRFHYISRVKYIV